MLRGVGERNGGEGERLRGEGKKRGGESGRWEKRTGGEREGNGGGEEGVPLVRKERVEEKKKKMKKDKKQLKPSRSRQQIRSKGSNESKKQKEARERQEEKERRRARFDETKDYGGPDEHVGPPSLSLLRRLVSSRLSSSSSVPAKLSRRPPRLFASCLLASQVLSQVLSLRFLFSLLLVSSRPCLNACVAVAAVFLPTFPLFEPE